MGGGADFLLDLFSISQFVDCSYICIFIAHIFRLSGLLKEKTGGEVTEKRPSNKVESLASDPKLFHYCIKCQHRLIYFPLPAA